MEEIKNEKQFLDCINQIHSMAIQANFMIKSLCRIEPNDMSSMTSGTFSAFEDTFFEKIKEIENLSGIVFNYLREYGNYRPNF